jgi:phage I-like protein
MIAVMSNAPKHTALMNAQDLPGTSLGDVPEWIQLLPAGLELTTADGRGPYRVLDAQAVAAASTGRSLPIDENHAIDIKSPRGEPAPAVGRVVEVEARPDGSIWGRAEWNSTGRELMMERAYIGLSPAVLHDSALNISQILRASLTNKPNLRGMTALHMETDMDLSALAKALGLADDATMEAILAAVAKLTTPAAETVALQSQLGQIGVALGLAQDAAPTVILEAAQAKSQGDGKVILALQSELANVVTKLNVLTQDGAKAKAETFVDGEIKRGRVGVKPLREHYIAMHCQDAGRVEKEILALPILGAGNTILPSLQVKEGEVSLHSAHVEAAKALGMDPKTYAAALKADNEESL